MPKIKYIWTISFSGILLLGLLFLSTSCVKDMIDNVKYPPKWTPQMAFPIGYTELTLNNNFAS